jgi:hypothetical protein
MPGEGSPVLLTTNCRLSFDSVRTALSDCDCWILVIDTGGLDVGSAAAAGRFAAPDIERGIHAARLDQVVNHRVLVMPGRAARSADPKQLAAHGGFTLKEGPRRARDIAAFIAEGYALAPGMMEERFGIGERVALIPGQLFRSLQWWMVFAFAAIIYAGLGPEGVNLGRALAGCLPFLILGAASVVAGSILAPLLPVAPPLRSFFLRGLLAGAAATGALLYAANLGRAFDTFLAAGCWLFFPTASGLLSHVFASAAPQGSPVGSPRQRRGVLVVAVVILCLAAVAFALAKSALWHV